MGIKEYVVVVNSNLVEEDGEPIRYTRSEAIEAAREMGGNFRLITTDITASKRRGFRLSDSDMYKLGEITKKKYKITNKSEALRELIYEAYEKI